MKSKIIKFFNLSADAQIVHLRECYSDNDGNFLKIFILENDDVLMKEIKGDHHPLINAYAYKDEILAPKDVIKEANEIYKKLAKDLAYRHVVGQNTYVGCEVILWRSKIAPNKVPLMVERFTESHFDYFGHRVPNQIMVSDGIERWIVSANCIKMVSKGLGFI